MKVSKIFHYLYFSVMALPLILIPVFMIYSHRHSIDNFTIDVPQNEVVNFNQYAKNSHSNVDVINNVTFTKQDANVILTGGIASNVTYYILDDVYLYNNNTYYLKGCPVGGSTSTFQLSLRGGSYNDYGDGIIFSPSTSANGNFVLTIRNGVNVDGLIFTPQVYNLTQMFGAGNEPTMNKFNEMFPDVYPYTLNKKMLAKGYQTVTYSDTDIMSQFTYNLYNAVDKYFNISQFFGLNSLWDFMVLNWFGGNVTIFLQIFWQMLCYWLVVSIAWLIFDLFMYLPNLAHRWLDRGAIE